MSTSGQTFFAFLLTEIIVELTHSQVWYVINRGFLVLFFVFFALELYEWYLNRQIRRKKGG